MLAERLNPIDWNQVVNLIQPVLDCRVDLSPSASSRTWGAFVP